MKPPDYVSHGRTVWDTPEPMEDAGAVTPETVICGGALGLTALITGIVAWATRQGKESMTCEGCGPRCPSCGERMDEIDGGTVACEACSVVVVRVLDKMQAEQEQDAKRQDPQVP